MRAMTPQRLADWLQLYMVRVGAVWYGCRNRPEWLPMLNAYDVRGAGIEVMVLWHDVLYIGDDKNSLMEPSKTDKYEDEYEGILRKT